MYEAIAFVISAMPMEQASQSLREFSLEILAVVHAAATKLTPATKEELKIAIGRSHTICRVLHNTDCRCRWVGEPRGHAWRCGHLW